MPSIPDNYDLWEAHEARQQEQLDRLPVCDCCDEPIQHDHYYEIHGEKICPRCMNVYYKREVEDFDEN